MQKYTFGVPEEIVPSHFCSGFCYKEKGVVLKKEIFNFRQMKSGCVLEWEMEADTQIFGFGLQLKRFNHTGYKVVTRVNADPTSPNGEGHAPVPFFVTNKGYGIYFDTARYAEFYCGRKRPDGKTQENTYIPVKSAEELYVARHTDETVLMSVFIPHAEGIEIYVIEGNTITDIVSQYNQLSGGGPDVPEWGLGVMYRCCGSYDEKQVRDMAKYFRENEIPCDILGLEPGWQSCAYSCSFVWDRGRFPNSRRLIEELRDDGYHINVWEHAFTHPSAPIYDEIVKYSGDYAVWDGAVPDFATPQAKKIFAKHHKEEIINLGVDGFKLDECDGSDNTGGWSFPLHSTFPSGLDGEQYHSLFGTLYVQALQDALGERETFSEVRNLGALASSYPFVLYSDLYEHRDFVRGTVTSGMSGLLWSPEVRHAENKKDLIRRLQSVIFSVQCVINGWYCEEVPWKNFDCEKEVRELLQLRKNLVPMLKKAFDKYRDTGKPPIRALVMDYTDDAETYKIDDEYMFCDDLLVAPIIGTESDEREVYLPNGEWIDFFTGESVKSGRFIVCTEGIPVYKNIEGKTKTK